MKQRIETPKGEFWVRPMEESDLEPIRLFTDRAIGHGYYSTNDLKDIWQRSHAQSGRMMTLVLENQNGLAGVRITYPPGRWEKGKGKGLSESSWPHPLSKTAYFQSLFIAPEYTGLNLGRELSLQAIPRLRQEGALGIVCHSWKESPHDSSGRYLRGLGFKLVATHPFYWKEVDYDCTCGRKPCLCTAEEMYLDLGTKGSE